MSREVVIEVRARAIFNKFWAQLSQNPDWLRSLFQNNPELVDQLIQSLLSPNGAAGFQQLRSAIEEIGRQEARTRATTQVDSPPFTLEWVQETLENL
jgi:hypothetical protein